MFFFNPNISVKDKTCSGTTVPVFVCQLLSHSAPEVKKQTETNEGFKEIFIIAKGHFVSQRAAKTDP